MTDQEKVSKLYRILVQRTNGMEVMCRALRDSCQSGALYILNQAKESRHMYEKYQKLSFRTSDRDYTCGNEISYNGTFGDRMVKVKVFATKNRTDMDKAFNEIQKISCLDWHENIVRFLIASYTDSNFSQIQSFADEPSDFAVAFDYDKRLKDYMANLESNVQKRSLCRQIFEGVQFLHNCSSRIIHLNLSEETVYISLHDLQFARAKIGGFEFAKSLGPTAHCVEESYDFFEHSATQFTPELLHCHKENGDLQTNTQVVLYI